MSVIKLIPLDDHRTSCAPKDARYVAFWPVCGKGSVTILPVILKGSRDKHDRSPVWSWNGDVERPTIKPSIRSDYGGTTGVSHYWLNDGMCQYLTDSAHEWSGKLIPLCEADIDFFDVSCQRSNN